MQFATLDSAKILVEGLKRAGRDLSREKLVTAIEGFYDFDTGLTPAVSYGPNRRIGAMGAYVVSAVALRDPAVTPPAEWIELDRRR